MTPELRTEIARVLVEVWNSADDEPDRTVRSVSVAVVNTLLADPACRAALLAELGEVVPGAWVHLGERVEIEGVPFGMTIEGGEAYCGDRLTGSAGTDDQPLYRLRGAS